MDRPIAVGDLVQVVRPPPCGCATSLGNVFVVTQLLIVGRYCVVCGETDQASLAARGMGTHTNGKPFSICVKRLRRIPPLSELEGERTQEPVREEV